MNYLEAELRSIRKKDKNKLEPQQAAGQIMTRNPLEIRWNTSGFLDHQIPFRATIVLLFLLLPASAKSLWLPQSAGKPFSASSYFANGLSGTALRNFESAMTPYLRARLSHTILLPGVYVPKQVDYFTLAKYWSALSQEFKDLYSQASDIPSGLSAYDSPGGHYQILYYTTGSDAVDLTDTIGYSKSNWRVQQSGSNGVPDYVEYVAYAADSAWSMEVEKFGFPPPYPYIDDGYTSPKAKIFIHYLGYQYYGQTWPVTTETVPGGIGFRSYFEIQNNWNSFAGVQFRDGSYPEYDIYPQKAIQVTCVHENFHTIQFAMTKQLSGDGVPQNFPRSWIEGTAVLMEDLGFNYVHDYFQYVPDYDPQQTVFESDDNGDIYKNGIVTIYLSQFTADTPCICFIKNMFFSDYHSPIGFVKNLETSASQYGHTWAEMLGNFHTRSYYTGSRAVPGRFIKDASLIKNGWSYSNDSLDPSGSVTKSVNPFAMNTFSYLRRADDNPTLGLRFVGDTAKPGDSDTSAVWSVHCILKRDSVSAHDTLAVMPFSSKGVGALDVVGWHNYSEALVIATNARYDVSRSATVIFQVCGISVRKGDTEVYSSIGQSILPSVVPHATVTVHANADLACSLHVSRTTITPAESLSALNDSLIQTGSFYDVEFPVIWSYGDAMMQLSIAESPSTTSPIAAAHHITDTSFVICRWNFSVGKWSRSVSNVGAGDSTNVNWQCSLMSPGVYGLFARAYMPDSAVAFIAFPNPARIASHKPMLFRGSNILELWIYSIDGTLIVHDIKGQNNQPQSLAESPFGLDWNLSNSGGKTVSPGVYYAKVGFLDTGVMGERKKMQKLFVIP